MPLSPPLCLRAYFQNTSSVGNDHTTILSIDPQTYTSGGVQAQYDGTNIAVGMYATSNFYGMLFRVKSISSPTSSSVTAVLEDINGFNKVINVDGDGNGAPYTGWGYIFELNDDGLPALTAINNAPTITFPDSILGRFIYDRSISTYRSSRLYARGTGTNNTASRLVVLNGTEVVNTGTRGLTLTIINGATLAHVSSTNYDTHGSTTASDSLATALNGLTRVQLGVLTSFDAWEANITANLRTAAIRLGLSKLGGFQNIPVARRRPYAAIFYGGGTDTTISTREVVERIESQDADAPVASVFVELTTDGTYGTINGANSTNVLYNPIADSQNPTVLVNSDGNVGIGTISPLSLVHFGKGNYSTPANSTDGTSFGLTFGSTNFTEQARILSVDRTQSGGAWGGVLAFHTASNTGGGANIAERMRIDPVGNIGIGTSNPLTVLDVRGVGATLRIGDQTNRQPTIELNRSGGAFGTSTISDWRMLVTASGGNFQLIRGNTTNTITPIHIDGTVGSVGINTGSSNIGTLHVRPSQPAAGNSDAIITLQARNNLDSGGTAQIRAIAVGTVGLGTSMTFSTRRDDGANFDPSQLILERMRINANGNVGIGLPNPPTLTSISFPTAVGFANRATNVISNYQLSLFDGGTGTGGLYLGSYYTIGVGAASTIQSSDTFGGVLNPAQLLLQPLGGNVGIGTSSPSQVLDVNGSITTRGGTTNTTSGYITVTRGDSTNTGIVEFLDGAGARRGYIGNISSSLGEISVGSGTALRFITNGGANERMRITSAGDVGIGTNIPQRTFHVNKAGDSSYVRVSGDVAQQQAVEFFDSAQRWVMYKPANSTDLRFFSGSDRVTITSDGNMNVSGTMTATSFSGNGTIPLGGIIMWSGSVVPTGWQLCNGTGTVNGSPIPDLRDRFIIGAGNAATPGTYSVGNQSTNTTASITLTTANLPAHTHNFTLPTTGYTASYNSASEVFSQSNNNGGNRTRTTDNGTGTGTAFTVAYYALAFIIRIA